MTKKAALFRQSRMPLYLQVAKLMRQQIEKQHWPYGTQIPTLDELEQQYQVSRITLRAALTQLEDEGIVQRTRGLGTFVAKDLSQQRWFRLANNMDQLVDTVANLEIRLLTIEQQPQTLAPAFDFGTPAAAYHRMRRVHYRDTVPYCVIDLYLEKSLFDSDPESFSNAPVIPQLAALSKVHIDQARQIMRITICDDDTASHLGIGIGDPIADVCRTLLDEHGNIVYYAHIQYPAQMIYVDTDLMQGISS